MTSPLPHAPKAPAGRRGARPFRVARGLCALILAAALPAAAQEAPEAPARVVVELGDVEVKVRRLTVTVTLDPDRAAALAETVAGASTARIEAERKEE